MLLKIEINNDTYTAYNYVDITDKTFEVSWCDGGNGCEITYSYMFGSDRDNTRAHKFPNATCVYVIERGKTVDRIFPGRNIN